MFWTFLPSPQRRQVGIPSNCVLQIRSCRIDNMEELAPGGDVDHVDVYYNAGHPGVEEPHVHVVLWHVAAADEARVAQ